MKRISADADRCSGCRLCELLCSFAHERQFSPSSSRIMVSREDRVGLDLPALCGHCDPCTSMENCPSEALERNDHGLVCVNEEKCTGCGKCVESCQIGAIRLDSQKNVPLICDQCDGKPLCVDKCPTKALTYVEAEMPQPKSINEVSQEALRRWKIIA